jgi:hypothetical protein
MGEQAQIIARARRLVWITWAFACATEVALVASAVVARV